MLQKGYITPYPQKKPMLSPHQKIKCPAWILQGCKSWKTVWLYFTRCYFSLFFGLCLFFFISSQRDFSALIKYPCWFLLRNDYRNKNQVLSLMEPFPPWTAPGATAHSHRVGGNRTGRKQRRSSNTMTILHCWHCFISTFSHPHVSGLLTHCS